MQINQEISYQRENKNHTIKKTEKSYQAFIDDDCIGLATNENVFMQLFWNRSGRKEPFNIKDFK